MTWAVRRVLAGPKSHDPERRNQNLQLRWELYHARQTEADALRRIRLVMVRSRPLRDSPTNIPPHQLGFEPSMGCNHAGTNLEEDEGIEPLAL